MDRLNEAVQDANVLYKAAAAHTGPDGLDPGLVEDLGAAIKATTAADLAQRNALLAVAALTEAQDAAMARGLGLIRKARNAAKARFGSKDKAALKEFKVGAERALTVKGMIADLAYFKAATAKRKDDLAKYGFRPADNEACGRAAAELERTDGEQERAKKAQKTATRVRDEALRALVRAAGRVRLAGKAVFADRPDVLVLLEPIKRARRKKGAGAAGKMKVVKDGKEAAG